MQVILKSGLQIQLDNGFAQRKHFTLMELMLRNLSKIIFVKYQGLSKLVIIYLLFHIDLKKIKNPFFIQYFCYYTKTYFLNTYANIRFFFKFTVKVFFFFENIGTISKIHIKSIFLNTIFLFTLMNSYILLSVYELPIFGLL